MFHRYYSNRADDTVKLETEVDMREPFIIFSVGRTFYAVRSEQVQQIEVVENVTPVPNTPDYVDGIVYLRGKVVPVINLRTRFGLERQPFDIYSRLVVIELEQRVVGLAVDSAREFIHLDSSEIIPPPESLSGPGVEYLEGVHTQDDRLILIVNLHRLLEKREKEQFLQDMDNGAFGQEAEARIDEARG
jgi:purine-binding chemotaxis protein CheW